MKENGGKTSLSIALILLILFSSIVFVGTSSAKTDAANGKNNKNKVDLTDLQNEVASTTAGSIADNEIPVFESLETQIKKLVLSQNDVEHIIDTDFSDTSNDEDLAAPQKEIVSAAKDFLVSSEKPISRILENQISELDISNNLLDQITKTGVLDFSAAKDESFNSNEDNPEEIEENPANSGTTPISRQQDSPSKAITDFHNGTKLTTLDYRNGTKQVISETMRNEIKSVKFSQKTVDQILENVGSKSNTVKNESSGYLSVTTDMVLEQNILFGFTYVLAAYQEHVFDIVIPDVLFGGRLAYADVDILFDISFGLRLPVRVTLEYPEEMILGQNYTLYATLTPLDKPDYNEFLFTFSPAMFSVECGVYIWVIPGVLGYWETFGPYGAFGPVHNLSSSFTTPLGGELTDLGSINIPIPIPRIDDIVVPTIVIIPRASSEKITTQVQITGDADYQLPINWSYPEQRIPFTVHVNEYGSSGFVDITLSDFRYYFSKFKLKFNLLLDFNSFINIFIDDPTIPIEGWLIEKLLEMLGVNHDFDLDVSSLTEDEYLGTHEGYPDRITIQIPVWERIYEDTHNRGTILKINTQAAEPVFKFITPDKDFGTRVMTGVREIGIHDANFGYVDDELRLKAVTAAEHDFCQVTAWDMLTDEHYVLVDNPGLE